MTLPPVSNILPTKQNNSIFVRARQLRCPTLIIWQSLDIRLRELLPPSLHGIIVRPDSPPPPLFHLFSHIPIFYISALLMASWKIAPALAAGCCIVLKPSELSPLTSVWLASIAHDVGLPAGVLNVIVGGRETGAALVSHAHIDKIAFTGSDRTGVAVMRAAANNITPLSLELGGKSAIVVFPDVNLDHAVEWTLFGCMWTNGQICSATSRLLVHESIASAFLDRLVQVSCTIRLVDPLDSEYAEETGTLGPLVSEDQLRKVEHFVLRATEQGAELLTGGRRHSTKGYFFEPTVLRVDPKKHDIWRTEVFGPVLAVATFASEDEAIALANDTPYGLAAAALTADTSRADRLADALKAGIVWLNCSQPCFVQLPWGGVKRSGIGRELGDRGIDNYLETKQVTKYIAPGPLGWYTMPSKL